MKRFCILPASFLTYPALFVFCGARVFGLLVLACAVHEAGHLIILRAARLRVVRITLTPAGLDIARSDGCSYRTDALVSLAGPLAGLCCALCAYYAGSVDFCAANLVCSVFNLLPVLPLDGGCALRSLLLCRLSLDRVDRVMRVICVCTLSVVYTASILLLLYTGWNVSLLLVCAVLFCTRFLRGFS